MHSLPIKPVAIIACLASLSLTGCVSSFAHKKAEKERSEFMQAYLQSQSAANMDRAAFLRSEVDTLENRVSDLETRVALLEPQGPALGMPPSLPDAGLELFEPETPAAEPKPAIDYDDGIQIPSEQQFMSDHKLPAVPKIPMNNS